MSTITTDGKFFVYAVFQADGCECEFLDSLHATEQLAEIRCEEIRKDPYAYAHKPELVSWKLWEVNSEIRATRSTEGEGK